ncbi:MAG TPA: hypothetical protein VIP09_16435 [Dehalococcoidia bacterium]
MALEDEDFLTGAQRAYLPQIERLPLRGIALELPAGEVLRGITQVLDPYPAGMAFAVQRRYAEIGPRGRD